MSESESEQPEPTMEEILASIRRIISEDGEEGEDVEPSADASAEDTPEPEVESAEEEQPAEAEPAEEEPVAEEAAEEEEVLELTDIVEEGDPDPEPEPEPEPEVGFEEEPEPEPEPQAEYEPIPEELAPLEVDEPLVSDTPAEATSNAFAQLSGAMLLQGLTLDELVREMLKPMLKAWLDANLPQMVERLVEREISRLTGGKPRD